MAAGDSHVVLERDGRGFREDGDTLERECAAFNRSVVEAAGADDVVVAMSGGMDSTAAATLAVEAVDQEGAERVAEELAVDPDLVSYLADTHRASVHVHRR